jgi:hypothetical protein
MTFDPVINLGNLADLGILLIALYTLYAAWAKRMRKIEMKINIMFMYFRKGLNDSDKEAIDKFFSENG